MKCSRGHKWHTYKDPWFFLSFKDVDGCDVNLRSCPICFVQFIKKQVGDVE